MPSTAEMHGVSETHRVAEMHSAPEMHSASESSSSAHVQGVSKMHYTEKTQKPSDTTGTRPCMLHPFGLMASMFILFVVAVADPHLHHTLALLVGMVVIQLLYGMRRLLLLFVLVYVPINVVLAALFVLTMGNPAHAAYIFLRLIVIGLVSLPLLSTTEATVVRSLQTARAPRGLTLSMLISLRFIRVMSYQTKQVWQAHRTLLQRNTHRCPVWRLLIPLLSRTLTIADSLAHSIELRGFTLDASAPFTIFKPVYWSRMDSGWLALNSVLALGVVALWIAGWGVR